MLREGEWQNIFKVKPPVFTREENYEVFTDSTSAIDYIKAQNTFPTVIKADGLALGKGVIIAQNLEEAEQAVHEMIDDGKFGKRAEVV